MSTEVMTVDIAPRLDTALADSGSNLGMALTAIKAITSDLEAEAATNCVRSAKDWTSRVNDWFDPMVKAAHKAHKALTTRRGETTKAIESESDRVQKLINSYLTEKMRREQIAAREAQERERKRIEAERLAEAERMEKAGLSDMAAQVVEDATKESESVSVEVVKASTVAAKLDGVAGIEKWKWEITDGALIPRQFMTPDEKAITAYVNANKANASIPGIKIYSQVETRISR